MPAPAVQPPPSPDGPTDPTDVSVGSAAGPGLDDRRDIPPWRWWAAPAAVLCGVIFGSMATLVVELIGHSVGGSSLSNPDAVVSIIGDIVFDLCFVVSALAMVAAAGIGLERFPRLSDFGFRRAHLKLAVKWFAIAVVLYYLVTSLYAAALSLHGKDKLPSELSNTHNHPAMVLTAIFVCAIAPICEEFFFRGFLFGTLRKLRLFVGGRDVGVWIAAVITGIVFGLVHTGSASSQYLVPLGFLGFVLCVVRWRTGSLYPGMALHSANNAVALGVDELHWSALGIVGLIIASWAVIAAVAGPLGARNPPIN